MGKRFTRRVRELTGSEVIDVETNAIVPGHMQSKVGGSNWPRCPRCGGQSRASFMLKWPGRVYGCNVYHCSACKISYIYETDFIEQEGQGDGG